MTNFGDFDTPLPASKVRTLNMATSTGIVLNQALSRMADQPSQPTPIRLDGLAVVTVLDAYLDWLQNRVQDGSKAQRTHDWYQDYLQDFIRFHKGLYRIQDLTIAQRERTPAGRSSTCWSRSQGVEEVLDPHGNILGKGDRYEFVMGSWAGS